MKPVKAMTALRDGLAVVTTTIAGAIGTLPNVRLKIGVVMLRIVPEQATLDAPKITLHAFLLTILAISCAALT